MGIDMSLVLRVRHARTTCGTKAKVVQNPANIPTVEEWSFMITFLMNYAMGLNNSLSFGIKVTNRRMQNL